MYQKLKIFQHIKFFIAYFWSALKMSVGLRFSLKMCLKVCHKRFKVANAVEIVYIFYDDTFCCIILGIILCDNKTPVIFILSYLGNSKKLGKR